MKDTRESQDSTLGFFGPNLKRVLKDAGVSKYRLAKDLGLSYRIVQYWAEGSHRPSEANVEKVRTYLGIEKPESVEARLSAVESAIRAVVDMNLSARIAALEARIDQHGLGMKP